MDIQLDFTFRHQDAWYEVKALAKDRAMIRRWAENTGTSNAVKARARAAKTWLEEHIQVLVGAWYEDEGRYSPYWCVGVLGDTDDAWIVIDSIGDIEFNHNLDKCKRLTGLPEKVPEWALGQNKVLPTFQYMETTDWAWNSMAGEVQ